MENNSLDTKKSTELSIVSKSLKITNKLLAEIDSKNSFLDANRWVEIPDENFQKALIKLGIKVVLGKVLLQDISCIKELCFNDENNENRINSFQGLEHFLSLEILICSVIQGAVDLDLSKNINLVKLDCHLGELNTIDISKNINTL